MAKVELTKERMKELSEERKNLYKTLQLRQRSYVRFVNKVGTRFISAIHRNDGRWRVHYGKIVLIYDDGKYFWHESRKQVYSKTYSGIEIPKYVRTKKDFLELVKTTGIFEI